MDDVKTVLRFWIDHKASPLKLAQPAQGPCTTLPLVLGIVVLPKCALMQICDEYLAYMDSLCFGLLNSHVSEMCLCETHLL